MLISAVMSVAVNESITSLNGTLLQPGDHPLLSDRLYLSMGIYLTTLGVLTVVGNLLVLLVLAVGRPNFLTIHSALLISGSSADIAVAAISFPLSAISSFNKRWMFGDAACVLSAFAVYFLVMVNINSLCVMAICRYIIVCRPHLEKYIRGRFVKYTLLFVWLYPLVWAGPPLIGWSGYVLESFGTTCTLDFGGTSTSARSYNVLCCVICYALPVTVFIVCYYNVASITRRRNTVFHGRGLLMTSSDRAMDEINRKLKIKVSRRMTVICFFMILSFVITWTPYALVAVITILTTKPVSPEVLVLPTMMAKLSCAANPLIYCGLCARFREAATRVFSLINSRLSRLLPVQKLVGPLTQPVEDISVFNLKDIQPCAPVGYPLSRKPVRSANDGGHKEHGEAREMTTVTSCTKDTCAANSGDNRISVTDSVTSTSVL